VSRAALAENFRSVSSPANRLTNGKRSASRLSGSLDGARHPILSSMRDCASATASRCGAVEILASVSGHHSSRQRARQANAAPHVRTEDIHMLSWFHVGRLRSLDAARWPHPRSGAALLATFMLSGIEPAGAQAGNRLRAMNFSMTEIAWDIVSVAAP
jgi:hypothetical protein